MKTTLSALAVIIFLSLILGGCLNTVTYDNVNNLDLNYVAPLNFSQPTNGYPAIVFIHGYNSVKEEMMNMAIAAASRGYFAITIDWREPDGTNVMWPAQLDDAKKAVAWLIRDTSYASNWSVSNPYRIDPNRIGAAGFSLGGMISLRLTDINGPNVKAAASFAGVSDFETEYRYLAFNEVRDIYDPYPLPPSMNVIVTNFLKILLGPYQRKDINNDGKPDYDPDYFEASPINHIKANASLLLIHGNQDIAVPPSQARSLMEKVRSQGIDCDLFIFNTGHSMDPGLATAPCPSKEMDVNSGIKYTNSKTDTGMDLMFEFFQAKL
jgi:dipeptidyl aminopeptidase/acylaminoacyl peptidase